MNKLLMKVVALSLLASSQVFAMECISSEQLDSVATTYTQLKTLVDGSEKYCIKDHKDNKWFHIARSLVSLKYTIPNEPTVRQNDALTFKSISEKDWWGYFTKRAQSFSIDTSCQPGVIAYVYGFSRNGKIFLCDPFFAQSVYDQASTMMHEVRHFDGYRHVMCRRGSEKGSSGACDPKITDRGSYGISVQTLVGFARSNTVAKKDQEELAAKAVYMAFNKFNIEPEVQIENTVVLSHESGDVYSWNYEGAPKLVKRLEGPAKIYANGSNQLTVYPVDRNQKAYRTTESFGKQLPKPGKFAEYYNSLSEEKKPEITSVNYFAEGGFVQGNEVYALCTSTLGSQNLDNFGNFKSILTLSRDNSQVDQVSYLLSDSGVLYYFSCLSRTSTNIKVTRTSLSLSGNSQIPVQAFGFKNQNFALGEDGVIYSLKTEDNMIETKELEIGMANSGWLSIAPTKKAELF